MKLLFAEDDPDVTRGVVAILERNNYVVDAVDNGLDAYDYIMEGDYVTAGQEALGISAWGHRIDVHNSTPEEDAHSIYTMYNNLK